MAINPNNLSATATLTFSEDFNKGLDLWNGTSGLDTRPGWAMWPQFNAGFTQSGNGEKGWYIQPSYAPTAAANPFRVSNGVLTISANPTPSNLLRYTNNLPYTTGWIDTYHEFSQTYGYFEMRAQLPAGRGPGRPSGCCPRTIHGRRRSTRSKGSTATATTIRPSTRRYRAP